MKRNLIYISTIHLLIVGFFVIFGGNAYASPDSNTRAIVVMATNGAFVEIRGERMVAREGVILQAGDRAITELGGRMDLMLTGGVIVRLGTGKGPVSLRVEDLKAGDEVETSKVFLENGEVGVRVNSEERKQNVYITTPTAVANVRGTGFLISAKKDETELLVQEGVVNMSIGTVEKTVKAGQACYARFGKLKMEMMEMHQKHRIRIIESIPRPDRKRFESLMSRYGETKEMMEEKSQKSREGILERLKRHF